MKKCLICLLISPLFAAAQQTPVSQKFSLWLGLSLNNTVTVAAPSEQYSNRPNSSYMFPEVHAVGNLAITQNADLMLRFEGGLTFVQNRYNLVGTNGYTDYKSAYKVNEVVATINPQLLYSFLKVKNDRFYGAGGFSMSAVSVGVNASEFSSIQGAAYYPTGSDYESQSLFRFGGNLKVGFVTGRFDVYFDYNKTLAATSGSLLGFSLYNPTETADQRIYKIGVNYWIKLPIKKSMK